MALPSIPEHTAGDVGHGAKVEQAFAAAEDTEDAVAAKRMFRVSRGQSESKRRWVDGTPEYSLYIWPLLKLFPRAKFIHIIRDVRAAVRSS